MEKNEITSQLCRIDYPVKTQILDCYIHVCPAFGPKITPAISDYKQYRAQWDTGAERSVITPRVIEELNLKPVDTINIHAMDTKTVREVFLVNFMFSNQIGFGNILATGCGLGGGNDVLIGMDVISRTDFFLTQENEKTVLFFRVPPIGFRDLESVAHFGAHEDKNIPRNRPCLCGSGKKYKHCCAQK